MVEKTGFEGTVDVQGNDQYCTHGEEDGSAVKREYRIVMVASNNRVERSEIKKTAMRVASMAKIRFA